MAPAQRSGLIPFDWDLSCGLRITNCRDGKRTKKGESLANGIWRMAGCAGESCASKGGVAGKWTMRMNPGVELRTSLFAGNSPPVPW